MKAMIATTTNAAPVRGTSHRLLPFNALPPIALTRAGGSIASARATTVLARALQWGPGPDRAGRAATQRLRDEAAPREWILDAEPAWRSHNQIPGPVAQLVRA